MTQLAPHQQRVVDEKRELDAKLEKLTAFISSEGFTVIVQDEAERGRLVCQEETMKDYSGILAERIGAFAPASVALPVVETKAYADGTVSTGTAPLPNASPVTEQELAAAAVAPRVTEAELEAEIANEWYFTAREGVLGELASDGVPPTIYEQANAAPQQLGLLTFCVLVLRNGFTVTGESACASAANFDPEIGRRLARKHAVGKVWPLLGFRLRDKLAGHA